MICPGCCDRHHDECRGGTWCDCQHVPGKTVEDYATGGLYKGDLVIGEA